MGGDASRQVGDLEFTLEEHKVALQELEAKLATKSEEIEKLVVEIKALNEKNLELETAKANFISDLVIIKFHYFLNKIQEFD